MLRLTPTAALCPVTGARRTTQHTYVRVTAPHVFVDSGVYPDNPFFDVVGFTYHDGQAACLEYVQDQLRLLNVIYLP